MTPLALILVAGLAAAAGALVLLRAEAATGPAGIAPPAPATNAMAALFAWTSLAALTVAGIFALGLVAPVGLGLAALLLVWFAPASPRLMPFYVLKLPLAAGAMIAAIAAWLGVLTLFGGNSHV